MVAQEPTVAGGPEHAAVAGQWRLVWWKFRRHRLAMASGVVVLLIYLIAVFAEVIAPGLPGKFNARYTFAPPQPLSFTYRDEAGALRFQLHVKGYKVEVDPVALRRTFVVDPSQRYPVGFFVHGDTYRLWGLFATDRHLIGPRNAGDPFFLLGADRLGRDVLSRVVYGTRVSMSIGLIGVAVSLVLGIMLGGISGYYGGAIDGAIQRTIEFIISIPTIPLWMGLAAAIPPDLEPLTVYFIITVIISLIGWTGLAREVRGRFLSLKSEDFVAAARIDGTSEMKIIVKHLVPAFASHIIASVTLAIPAMIIAETSLSFLGIGLRPPVVSWGVLLQEAQNIRAVATAPWLLAPAVPVITAVLALNFLGDGLRDAADPYSE